MKTIQLVGLCLLTAIGVQPLDAQDSRWTFTAGVGIGGENVYPGSDDYYVSPLPSMSASYRSGNLSYSISILDGVGITYIIPKWGLIATANVNAGARRDPAGYSVLGISVDHSEATRELLADSPDLDAPLVLSTTLLRATPIGLIGASLDVHRTTVGSFRAQPDHVRTGLVYSLQYLAGGQVSERLSLSGLVTLEYMDETYADTWHTRPDLGESTGAFDANAGLRGSMVAMEAQYWISERVSLSVLGASTILMGDAKDSPFTAETLQRVMRTQVLYHF